MGLIVNVSVIAIGLAATSATPRAIGRGDEVLRYFTILFVCIMAWESTATAVAQTIHPGQNPLLADVIRVDPGSLAGFIARLEALARSDRPTTGDRGPLVRKGLGPTDTEAAQIAANPAFGQAYERDPESTLSLLREVNEDLRVKRLGHKP